MEKNVSLTDAKQEKMGHGLIRSRDFSTPRLDLPHLLEGLGSKVVGLANSELLK